ncbi:Glutamate-1-semialdehyde 2,1-aminomutase [Hibiscus syriacus]|uniref:Glutamate-1-semialdehyde 2,1-aminomutase n=1 Tax=Hibiscus syriacus TaxID=106335 RepID=A0A6A2WR13_HIBSY|nr:Glutamate-1-semialdehyde 2,1-aminomutase [Hibiscus syriacus]
MKKGTSFGAPCLLENVLAESVISAVPSIEMDEKSSSNSRDCLGLPDSPGVPKAATLETLTAPYNDISAVESLFQSGKGVLAAIILEPFVGNSFFIPPKPDFLEAIRRLTKENDALLIFDEVMTGFRLSYGGAQEYFGITPGLTTLGKIIGGGLPVGAYGGRTDIMEMGAPAGPMYQAGTLSGNPLAMTAGIHTLKRLKEPGTYEYLDKITGELVRGILDAGKKTGHGICGGHICGMFGFFFTEGPVHNFDDAKKSDTAKFARFHRGVLEEDVYLAPSQFDAGFTSLAHSLEDIEKTIAAAEKVLSRI